MTAGNTYKPETHWDQSEFETLKASWSKERIKEDERQLKEIFKLAADIPLLAEALDWANTHGIKFFIDRQATGVAGYYQWGTGVVGLAAYLTAVNANPMYAVGTFVHEIRHAWQDYYGFISSLSPDAAPGDFATYFIQDALIEADAKAIGLRARDEYRAAEMKVRGWPVPDSLQSRITNRDTDLGEKFLSWFSPLEMHTEFYGDHASKFYGQKWGVYDGPLPKHHMEFMLTNPPQLAGIDISNIQDVLQLGKSFSGANNYFAALPPDTLPKQILRPSLADTFWEAANDNQRKLTTELRKAYLRKKLARRPPGAQP